MVITPQMCALVHGHHSTDVCSGTWSPHHRCVLWYIATTPQMYKLRPWALRMYYSVCSDIIMVRIPALQCSSSMLRPQLRLCRMAWVRGEGRESNKATNIYEIGHGNMKRTNLHTGMHDCTRMETTNGYNHCCSDCTVKSRCLILRFSGCPCTLCVSIEM